MEWWEDKVMPRTLGFIACASLVGGALFSLLQQSWGPILYVLAGITIAMLIFAVMTGINALLFIPIMKLMARAGKGKSEPPEKQ